MYSSKPSHSWLLSNGSPCGDRRALANNLSKSSCAELALDRFGGSTGSSNPGVGRVRKQRVDQVGLDLFVCHFILGFDSDCQERREDGPQGNGLWGGSKRGGFPKFREPDFSEVIG